MMFLYVWLIGALASLCVSGYWSGKEAVLAVLNSRFNNPTINGWMILANAIAWPAQLVHIITWHQNAKRLGIKWGPFRLLQIPRDKIDAFQAGDGIK